jgi:spermidine synthase
VTSLRFPLVLLCFVLSGFAALLYQTAWTREFAFVFGTSDLAVVSVLAAYMGGLAAGAAAAARFAGRVERPVLVYGLLELGIAASALAVPAAIRAATALHTFLFGGHPAPPEAGQLTGALFYLLCSFAILLIPTALMGATLPLLARHSVHRDEQIGSRIGVLYAVNTAGAVLGTLCAAFVLLPALGLRRTVYVGAAFNALVFALAALLARGAAKPEPEPAAPAAAGAAWILPLIALSGVTSFAYEVLWTRLLGHVLGGSVYAFATMLASFLVGIAAGSAVAARLASNAARAARGFAVAQLGIAALSLAAFAGIDAIPGFARVLGAGRDGTLAANAAVAALVLLPGALCIGATFPFAVRLLAREPAAAPAATARIYTWNTVGAIAGAIATGFWLLPGLGFEGTVAFAAGLNLLLAGLCAARSRPLQRAPIAAAACAAVALFLFRPGVPWTLLRTSPLGVDSSEGEVTYFGVGRSASVLLVDDGRSFRLTTNGLPESQIFRADRERPGHYLETRWLGMLPVLANPSARSILIVGLGGGKALEAVPSSVASVGVIELEEEVVRANQAVGALRGRDPLADPRVRLYVNDARGALQLTIARYDGIVSQPSHPWTAGASHLYTREFFELVREHLAPGGVFVQWIGLGFVDAPLLKTLIATLLDVFPAVRLYQPTPGALLFLASGSDPAIETRAAQALAAAPEDYARYGLHVPEDVVAACVLGVEGAREFSAGAPINTDDHNLLAARSAALGHRALFARGLMRALSGYPPLVAPPDAALDRVYLVRRLEATAAPARADALAASLRDPVEKETAQGFLKLERAQRLAAARSFERALALAPGASEARFGLLEARQEALAKGDPALRAQARRLPAGPAAVIAGWRADAAHDDAALRRLDAELARAEPRQAAFLPATRLRASWRIHSADPRLAAEAVALLDGVLAVGAQPADLLLRAQAGAVAGRPELALATLDHVAELLARSQPSPELVRAGLGIVDGIAAAQPQPDGRTAAVRERLVQLLQ